jgi:hypothetical protein
MKTLQHARGWLLLILALCLLIDSSWANAKNWLTSKYEVKSIQGGDRFSVDFNGLALMVRLVSVKISDSKGAKKYLEESIKGKKITIIPEESAGTSSEGFQFVYAILKSDDGNLFANEELIKKGFATYDNVESKTYDKLQTALKKASLEQTTLHLKVKQTDFDNKDKVCSELYSKRYHLMSCRWAKMIDAQSRIVYKGFPAAEKAGKQPCSKCLYERVKNKRVEEKKSGGTSGAAHVGGLFGVEKYKRFYSPVSKRLRRIDKGVVKFETLKDAKASGYKADPGSLRIDNPVLPAPTGKECIGRALPYLRPCRRETELPTGLCEPCLNGRIK